MTKALHKMVLAALLLTFSSALALSQETTSKSSLECRDNWNSGRLASHCEIKEFTLPSNGSLNVNAGKNGGVSIKGWDRNEILVRARVQAGAPTKSEAEALGQQITIQTAGGTISATGPEHGNDYHWSVNYEVFVPRRSDLSLETRNGGLAISDVYGRIQFQAVNGGVVLRRVGGSVRGSTTNGGLVVELTGEQWDGEELDVRTTNGGIVMSVPENYSAHLQTGTVNGNLSVDFPGMQQDKKAKELAVYLGSGGARVRAMTTNGGVKIKRTALAY
ncbi:MAG TPA: DUF4097 family beta strand repeat-containing protein [Pyrinomonadaceae bacterium]|nr:DUF4097 family beta strand repeat-containing protein [Pyrinomonadaceae bacterium]